MEKAEMVERFSKNKSEERRGMKKTTTKICNFHIRYKNHTAVFCSGMKYFSYSTAYFISVCIFTFSVKFWGLCLF